MKNTLYILSTVVILAACSKGGGDKVAEKRAELAKLEAEEKKISESIKQLKSELNILAPAKEVEKVIAVTVSPITTQTFNHFVEIQGRIDAKNNIFVSPQMGGAITNLYVKEGDFVKQGQVIATIDNSVLKQSIQEIDVQLGTAKVFYEKQKALWDQKIGTEVQYIQAKANVDALEKRLATLQTQTAMTKVIAPLSGFVDEVRMKAGEMAAPGLGIVRIVNSDNLKVVAQVADTYASTIKQGDVVNIKFPDLGKETSARLTFVSQTVNQASRTFTVEATIPKIAPQLKPNMLAVLNINDQAKGNSIIINRNIIQQTELGDIVYVAVTEGAKKVARSRKVTTGLTYNGDIEIISGLQAGDMLITQGYQDLVDGQAVNY
ncbi:efflux transporter, RND family, MFP subunit [Emticicia oligotrophica DSM 17448]|uniref:Efflux transporter, RND family, MFP subunit n=1 Tax=Emticicia oligotrophica (strain DSM 17448 / CIP 109782 / MTCC 6937 / GPTSA100-15) TaxID=929562 RepID=A0ABM5MZ55_EMTOG|nr:efflux RND transporter periplasmic adaptor subunit [Emticicia oligotrophica]AFK02455.1 efflux transporter, RND family, MFP subunit [Emticicia oligotrophica DSM 17448]